MAVGKPRRNPDRDDDVGNDRPDRTPGAKEAKRRAALRLEEIRQYLRDRQARREVVATTRTPSGVDLDWVPVESQLARGRPADPPGGDGPAIPGRDRRRPERPVTSELARRGARLGPAGTVPMVRLDVEAIRPAGTLQDWLSKDGVHRRAAPDDDPDDVLFPEEATTHRYAFSRQVVTCFGTEGLINAWDPFVEWSNEFSLGQLSLSRGDGGQKQTLEVGAQEYQDHYGDWVPHLFVFYTTNNYTQKGDNLGGYNEDVDGWVQVAQTIHPGAKITPLSAFDGTQYVLPLKVQLFEGNWWVRVNGVWMGYYPASLYATTGLRSQADRVSWYGEIVDAGSHAGTTRTDMGNGHWPYEGWRRCAYMRALAYQSSARGGMSPYAPAEVWASNPACYDIQDHFTDGGSWGPYFWWGGSGRNSGCP